jgi:aryl-alcohol dehydrogenase-like predicted oxidoreductase
MAVAEIPLVLGGHSFIQQLGNEPSPNEDEAAKLVEGCLNAGIRWFDTTYLPERIALGKALKKLGRRSEARIIAWNFFNDFKAGEEVGGPDYYEPQRLNEMLAQLQTDYIDVLIVHELNDDLKNLKQEAQVCEWASINKIKAMGIWAPGANQVMKVPSKNPYCCMVCPNNINTPETPKAFAAAKERDWLTFATSPFGRGWDLDKLVQAALKKSGGNENDVRAKLSDAMLRFSLFQPGVDRLIVSMRKPEWIAANTESVKRGPLSTAEKEWLYSVKQSA